MARSIDELVDSLGNISIISRIQEDLIETYNNLIARVLNINEKYKVFILYFKYKNKSYSIKYHAMYNILDI